MERLIEKVHSETLILRTHHVCVFGDDIVPKFLEFSHGVKPWEYPVNKFSEIIAFVQRFSKDEIEKDKMMRTYFENFVIESPTAEEDYLYTIDLIGTDEESYQKVLAGRTRFFMEIFRTVCTGKDARILLSDLPDGYCNSCAIGKHCNEKGPDEYNNDLKIRSKLIKLMETEPSPPFFQPGMAGFESDGRLFITAELLFNPKFHEYLTPKNEA